MIIHFFWNNPFCFCSDFLVISFIIFFISHPVYLSLIDFHFSSVFSPSLIIYNEIFLIFLAFCFFFILYSSLLYFIFHELFFFIICLWIVSAFAIRFWILFFLCYFIVIVFFCFLLFFHPWKWQDFIWTFKYAMMKVVINGLYDIVFFTAKSLQKAFWSRFSYLF